MAENKQFLESTFQPSNIHIWLRFECAQPRIEV